MSAARSSGDREMPMTRRLLAPTTDVALPFTQAAFVDQNVRARELSPPPLSRSVQHAVGVTDDSEDAGYGCAWNVADLQSQLTGLRDSVDVHGDLPVTTHNAKKKYVPLGPSLPLPPAPLPSQPPLPPQLPPPPISIIDTTILLENQK